MQEAQTVATVNQGICSGRKFHFSRVFRQPPILQEASLYVLGGYLPGAECQSVKHLPRQINKGFHLINCLFQPRGKHRSLAGQVESARLDLYAGMYVIKAVSAGGCWAS